MRYRTRCIRSAGLLAGFAFLCAASASRAQLLGNDFLGNLYDVNTTTGALTNSRPTGLNALDGIALTSTGTLFGLNQINNSLYRINTTTGAATLVGATGLTGIVEGDIAFDPTTNTLFGVQDVTGGGVRRLFSLNQSTGAATIIGNIGNPFAGDYSGMTFDSAGNLYLLDNASSLLVKLNKTNAAILSSVSIDVTLGSVAALAVDSSGTFYAGSQGPSGLYTINPTTGHTTLVGSNNAGLAGLSFRPAASAVPEPGSIALLVGMGMGGAGFLARRRRKAPKTA